MRALLDVNVLIALLDSDHTSHAVAFSWFKHHAGGGWASCPITQNGCIGIMANPGYPNTLPIQSVMKRLADACEVAKHSATRRESIARAILCLGSFAESTPKIKKGSP